MFMLRSAAPCWSSMVKAGHVVSVPLDEVLQYKVNIQNRLGWIVVSQYVFDNY